jgi:hypothetical protein
MKNYLLPSDEGQALKVERVFISGRCAWSRLFVIFFSLQNPAITHICTDPGTKATNVDFDSANLDLQPSSLGAIPMEMEIADLVIIGAGK